VWLNYRWNQRERRDRKYGRNITFWLARKQELSRKKAQIFAVKK